MAGKETSNDSHIHRLSLEVHICCTVEISDRIFVSLGRMWYKLYGVWSSGGLTFLVRGFFRSSTPGGSQSLKFLGGMSVEWLRCVRRINFVQDSTDRLFDVAETCGVAA
jgi:hypothetical protein